MVKVIEFYVRDLFSKKVKSVPASRSPSSIYSVRGPKVFTLAKTA
jgi:hypothetical protein